MHIFVSAGEPSGDLHGANLVRALRQLRPELTLSGFGAERMQTAGCDILYPLAEHAIIGITQAVAAVPRLWRVLGTASDHFAAYRPDAVVLIDNPGFHWWLARTARRHGLPVVYFVPPQIWAWGSWRAAKMRRLVDRVLCNLPFEQAWYESRGIAAHYVGHPYFDELRDQQLDPTFLARQRSRPGPIVGLLPGSRRQELANNAPSLLSAAEVIHRARPDVRFLVACLKQEHRQGIEATLAGSTLPIEVHAGRTPEIIELSHSTISVSGSVGLELLYRTVPSVVTYSVGRAGMLLAYTLKQSKYISLVNLLADRQLFPEYLSARCDAEAMAGHVLGWLNDQDSYESLRRELTALRDRVAEPGACDRAARQILDMAATSTRAAA
jgi:lipid-A-disaccharide synthase